MSLGLHNALGRLRDTLRTELWPLPILSLAAAVALGVAVPRVDARIDDRLPDEVHLFLFTGGPGAARTVLDAIAGSLITVTSLTFSLTVVTLQLASSQFSPRLLRTFTRDRFVHVTLGLFLATFTYALTVLRTVRTAEDGHAAFVPQLAVTSAFVLALGSVTGLVLFLAHLAREIRVETMLTNVHEDAVAAVRAVLGRAQNHSRVRPPAPAGAHQLLATGSGFLVAVDDDELLEIATSAGVVIVIDRRPGDSVVEGTPIGAVWGRSETMVDDEARARLLDRVAAGILVGPERTAAQDVGFGLRQLTDVAVKALSPGINDPTTAVHALGHTAALLREMAGYDPGDLVLVDDDGVARVGLARPSLPELLDVAVSQPRRYGAADPAVLGRLLQLLRELAWSNDRAEHVDAVRGQLQRMRVTIAAQSFDHTEQHALQAGAGQVDEALAGRWALSGRS